MIYHHSGDLGDIIYALPTIRSMGGGDVCLSPAIRTRETMTPARAACIIPLLEAQPYIGRAYYADAPPAGAIDLNQFRRYLRWMRAGGRNLAEAHLMAMGLHLHEWYTPWLIAEPIHVADCIIARSARYHRPGFDWPGILRRAAGRCAFVGTPTEHADFAAAYGPIPYHPTTDLLALASVIAGATLFVGNQSCPLAIAHGLGVQVVVEEWEHDPNCRFPRHRPFGEQKTGTPAAPAAR